jgi:hypothetical protein
MEMKLMPGPRTFATHRIANNAAATITNTSCLEKNVRTRMKRDEGFALITIIGLLPDAIAWDQDSLSMLSGT